MENNNKQIFDRLNSFLTSLDQGNLSKKDFVDAFQKVVEFVMKVEKNTQKAISGLEDAYVQVSAKLKEDSDVGISDIRKQVDQVFVEKRISAILKELSEKVDGKLSTVKDGKNGLNGKDADEAKIAKLVAAQLKFDGDKPEIIRNKLETLTGKNRLNVKAIDGLDDFFEGLNKNGGGKIIATRNVGGSGGIQLYINSEKKGLIKYLNLIPGSGIAFTYSHNNGRNDLTISAAGGSLSLLIATGAVDDSNVTFTFVSEPSAVIVNGQSYRKDHGWTWTGGTLTVTLANPVGTGGDIYGI